MSTNYDSKPFVWSWAVEYGTTLWWTLWWWLNTFISSLTLCSHQAVSGLVIWGTIYSRRRHEYSQLNHSWKRKQSTKHFIKTHVKDWARILWLNSFASRFTDQEMWLTRNKSWQCITCKWDISGGHLYRTFTTPIINQRKPTRRKKNKWSTRAGSFPFMKMKYYLTVA